MKIRLLKKTEISKCAEIVRKNYSKKWEKTSAAELKSMFSNSAANPIYYVAEEDNKIIGFIGFIQSWMDYNIYQIFWVNVDPSKQRQGVGKKLVAKVISEIKKKKNAALIQLSATLPNSKYYAQHFGFKTMELFGPELHHLMTLSILKKNIRQ